MNTHNSTRRDVVRCRVPRADGVSTTTDGRDTRRDAAHRTDVVYRVSTLPPKIANHQIMNTKQFNPFFYEQNKLFFTEKLYICTQNI